MSRGAWLVPLLLLLGAACSEPPDLRHPDTRFLEPAVRDSIDQARQAFERRTKSNPDDPQAYAELGKTYLAHHLNQAAADSFNGARALAPRDPAWHYYFGVASAQLGDLEAAMAAFRSVLRLNSDDAVAAYRLGRLLLGLGETQAARPYVDQALRGAPDDAAVLALAGELALATGRFDEADEFYRQALARQPWATRLYHPWARAQRSLDGGAQEQLLQRAGDGEVRLNDPRMQALGAYSRSTQMLLEQGGALLDAGNYRAAADILQTATEQNPASVFAWSTLGRVREILGDVAGARDALQQALVLDPGAATAHFFLGTLSERQGDDAAAIRSYRAALEADPDNPRPRLLLAHALLRERNDTEAAVHYGIVAQARPSNIIARYYMTLIELSHGRCDSAARWLEDALRLKDNYGPLLEAQARYFALCSTDPAALQSALETSGLLMQARPDARSAVTRAIVLAATGDAAGARRAREQALRLAASSAYADELRQHLPASGKVASAWPVGSLDLRPPRLGPDSLK